MQFSYLADQVTLSLSVYLRCFYKPRMKIKGLLVHVIKFGEPVKSCEIITVSTRAFYDKVT